LRRTPATALRRNAAIAAGNTGEVSPALRNALGAAAEDRDPTVREAARFALSRLAEDDPTA
jgi:epoxyqueuosine reductase QueG